MPLRLFSICFLHSLYADFLLDILVERFPGGPANAKATSKSYQNSR